MATYEETVVLKDGVSGPAKAAADSVSLIGKGIASVTRQLVKIGPAAEAAVAPVNKMADAMSRLVDVMSKLVAMGPIKLPRSAAEPRAGGVPKALPAGKPASDFEGPLMPPDVVKQRAAEEKALIKAAKDEENRLVKEAAAEAKALFKQKAAEEKALAKAALAEQNAVQKAADKQAADDAKAKAKTDASLAKDAQAAKLAALMAPKAGPPNMMDAMLKSQGPIGTAKGPAPIASVGGKMAFDPDSMKAAQAAAAGLKSKLEAAKTAMISAAATGDHEGFAKARQTIVDTTAALAKLPEPAKAGGQGIARALWIARNAMDVGRQTIEAGINGMRAAFSSLAQGDVQGAVKGVTDSIAGMAKMLDLVVPGLGQVVSAVISVAGGLVGITAGLITSGARFAIEASQAKQAMISMFTAMGEGKVTGEALDEMLSGLADRISISKDELAPLTKGFLQLGITGQDALEKLTLAAISATAIVGQGGAEAFTDLTKKMQLAAQTGGQLKIDNKFLKSLSGAGVTVNDLAKALGTTGDKLKDSTVDAAKLGDAITDAVIAKGAGPLNRLGSSLDAIKKKLMQDIGDIFEDIDVGPFMEQVKSLFAIFGQSTSSGQALKAGIGGFFKEVFESATKVVPLVKHFLLDMVIWGLKAYIALKPIVASIKEFFASEAGSAVLSMALSAIWGAMKGIGTIVLVVVGTLAAFLAVVNTVAVAIWALVGAAVTMGLSVANAVGGMWATVSQVFSDWAASAWQLATDFVTGLVNGIASGASMVTDAVSNLAGSAVSSFKGALGIASPSRVMMGLGGFTGEGFAAGLEGSAPDVHAASSSMAGLAVKGAGDGMNGQNFPAAMSGAGGPGVSTDNSKSTVINISDGAFVFNGVKDADQIDKGGLITELAIALERLQFQSGAGPERDEG